MLHLLRRSVTSFLFAKKQTRFSRKWNRELEIQKVKLGGTLK